MSNMQNITRRVNELTLQIHRLQNELCTVRNSLPSQPIQNFTLRIQSGAAPLLSLFKNYRDLIIFHHRGSPCSHSDLWADGFNGILHHIQSRAAFALVSPDSPDQLTALKTQRNWQFPVFSTPDSSFAEQLGLYQQNGTESIYLPGIAGLLKDENSAINLISMEYLTPEDAFSPVWPLFNLLKDGPQGWQPRSVYDCCCRGNFE